MARDKITNHREAVNIVTCPVMRSLLVLGGKWKLLLLYLSLKAAIYATVIL